MGFPAGNISSRGRKLGFWRPFFIITSLVAVVSVEAAELKCGAQCTYMFAKWLKQQKVVQSRVDTWQNFLQDAAFIRQQFAAETNEGNMSRVALDSTTD
jgi:hypothetical protein